MRMFSEDLPLLTIEFDTSDLDLEAADNVVLKLKNRKIFVLADDKLRGVLSSKVSTPSTNLNINLTGAAVQQFKSVVGGRVQFTIQPFFNLKRDFLVKSGGKNILVEAILERGK